MKKKVFGLLLATTFVITPRVHADNLSDSVFLYLWFQVPKLKKQIVVLKQRLNKEPLSDDDKRELSQDLELTRNELTFILTTLNRDGHDTSTKLGPDGKPFAVSRAEVEQEYRNFFEPEGERMKLPYSFRGDVSRATLVKNGLRKIVKSLDEGEPLIALANKLADELEFYSGAANAKQSVEISKLKQLLQLASQTYKELTPFVEKKVLGAHTTRQHLNDVISELTAALSRK